MRPCINRSPFWGSYFEPGSVSSDLSPYSWPSPIKWAPVTPLVRWEDWGCVTCQLARGRGKSALPGFLLQFQLLQDIWVTRGDHRCGSAGGRRTGVRNQWRWAAIQEGSHPRAVAVTRGSQLLTSGSSLVMADHSRWLPSDWGSWEAGLPGWAPSVIQTGRRLSLPKTQPWGPTKPRKVQRLWLLKD